MSRLRTALQAAFVAVTAGSIGITAAYAYWEGKCDGAEEMMDALRKLLEDHNAKHREDGKAVVDTDLVLEKAFEAQSEVYNFDSSVYELLMSGKWIGEGTKALLAECLINTASLGIKWIIADAMAEKANKQEAKRS